MQNSEQKQPLTIKSGIGFPGLLAILFILLKLTNTISWSWWWVLSPIWIPWSFVIIVGFITGLIIGIHEYSKNR